ncbi:unnamed protein product [Rhodiola kirilowii]
MQRQKSILSFFHKPSPGNQRTGGSSAALKHGGQSFPELSKKLDDKNTVIGAKPPVDVTSSNSCLEIDTPPEKVPRRVLPEACFGSDGERPSLFSSIMHKFSKEEGSEKAASQSYLANRDYNKKLTNLSEVEINSEVGPGSKFQESNVHFKSSELVNPTYVDTDNKEEAYGPETPGTRPLVPRLKRIQEDCPSSENRSGLQSEKRVRFFQDLDFAKDMFGNAPDASTPSKFEWLHPSRIRDANGRRPSDPLYDRQTLYVTPEALKSMSASQKQYWSVKCQYMDVLIFFKVGKFYELYELDAETGHKEFGWKITISGVGKCRQVGISEGGIDEAIQKLLARGYKVGRVEQLETSEQAKSRGSGSVIQRKLVRVLTPSTLVDGNIGPDAVHLLAIKEDLESGSNVYGFAFVDCATMKFFVGSITDDSSFAALGALLMQVSPKEVIYENPGLSREAQKALKKYSVIGTGPLDMTPVLPCSDFSDASVVRNLIKSKGYFKGTCDSWDIVLDGVAHPDNALSALGGLIGHLSRLMLNDTLCNGDIIPYQVYTGSLRMDRQTLINLEIFSNSADGGSSGTLYKYLDHCITCSGKRLLRNWICHPLRDTDGINNRLDLVENLMKHSEIIAHIGQQLRKLPDLERLLGRIKGSSDPSASFMLPLIGMKMLKQRVKAFGSLVKGLRIGMDLLVLLQQEGHLNFQFFKFLNVALLSGNDGLDKYLAQFEAAVDSDFPNYQDHDVTDSDVETLSILIEMFMEKSSLWCQLMHAICCIDVFQSFAVIGSTSRGAMCRPVLLPSKEDGPTLTMKGLWHPYAIGINGEELPVPNNINLGQSTDGYHPRSLLLTGPNMGGKSTLLRATCLTVILAQLGAYVPCEICVFSVVDTIFTRLGATDRIMTGESTFFVECAETASVLQHATQDSLVLLDELGRGTSTFDGYAIAYAVFRHLIEKVKCRLLFATHYHPLTKEFASHPHVSSQHMSCTFRKSQSPSKSDEELVFLYRLAPGACPESYGLQVALMAGIPNQVVQAATKAGLAMKKSIGQSFRFSEQRSQFSSIHEEWLKGVISVSRTEPNHPSNGEDNDALDALFCLWCELKRSYAQADII